MIVYNEIMKTLRYIIILANLILLVYVLKLLSIKVNGAPLQEMKSEHYTIEVIKAEIQ